ncbi:MAG TPA: DUF3788 family protein [Opitutaceae bacterium]|nr:DUF3788 family protein [Opitutaceae bacterium]
MKKRPNLDPDAAFPDEKRRPADSDLPGALGGAHAPLQGVLDRLRAGHPAVTAEWKYSPRSGWHLIYSLKQRRLFYLVLQRGNFRLSLILGGKAIAALQAGPCARKMPALLKAAQRYPEGTAFSFNRETLDADLAIALLEAKIAH